MTDELGDWAARRAPELLARAESEVVAALRQALLDAAVGPPPKLEPEALARASPRAPRGESLWAYGVTTTETATADITSTVAGEEPIERVGVDDLSVLVSRVPRAEFSEEPLRRNLNDMAWLERVARAHEAVLERALDDGPVVPLRLCTIFESDAGAIQMLDRHSEALRDALDVLGGRQEWSVKLLVDPEALLDAAAHQRGEAETPDALGSGAAYMLSRRAEREDRDAADRIAAEIAEDVHARLQDWAAAAVLLPAQNRELSGHHGEMLLNGAYLVEATKVAQLRELVDELRHRHARLKARIELSGPFPAYNFVPRLES